MNRLVKLHKLHSEVFMITVKNIGCYDKGTGLENDRNVLKLRPSVRSSLTLADLSSTRSLSGKE